MIFETFAKNELQLLPELGIGFYATRTIKTSKTKEPSALQSSRAELVNKFTKLDVLDIGTKDFTLARENTKCFTTDEADLKWLVEAKVYRHPFKGATALTFWKTLHLIADPRLHLSGADEYVFISCPIYGDINEMVKVEGQFWYFTIQGLTNFMRPFGFQVQEINWLENIYKNDNVATFVFKRNYDLE